MPKNLGNLFVQSMVRQVGRDAGKVISNKTFGDSHSTPIRMVGSSTEPQYSGTRRKYRHDLDRVVNGDLPSTKQKAKKQLVELENSYEEFIDALMPISSAEELLALKNWTKKSLDYIDDVVRIVSDDEVKQIASEVGEGLNSVKGKSAEAVSAMEVPDMTEALAKRRRARIIFWTAFIVPVVLSIIIASVVGTAPAEGEDRGLEGGAMAVVIVQAWGWIQFIWGIVALSKSSKNRKALERLAIEQEAMKGVIAGWA